MTYECTTWRGHPDDYQQQAAIRAVENGVTIMPWCWIEPNCATPMCINPEHLTIHRPRWLLYPDGICIYCGEQGWTKDHLLPISTTGAAVRKYVLTVPACNQCNSTINAAHAPSITERRRIAQNGIYRKNRKVLRAYEYTDAEIKEFGPGLRPTIIRAKQDREILRSRLNFPDDPDYDRKHLEASGILDPYAFGLLLHNPEPAAWQIAV